MSCKLLGQWQRTHVLRAWSSTSLKTDNYTNTSLRNYRPDALPDAHPAVSKHWRHIISPTNACEIQTAEKPTESDRETHQTITLLPCCTVLMRDTYLPADVTIVQVTNKQWLGSECVRLHVDICSSHLVHNNVDVNNYPQSAQKHLHSHIPAVTKSY